MFARDPRSQPGRDRRARHPRLPRDGHRADGHLFRCRRARAAHDAGRPRRARRPCAGGRRATCRSRRCWPPHAPAGPRPCTPATASCPRTPSSPPPAQTAGITFIGPSPRPWRSWARRSTPATLAERAGVPVIPGEAPADQSDEALLAAAARIGFPVLLKPSAGGGGIGMKVVVTQPTRFRTLRHRPGARPQAAFGDPTLYVERLIARAAPRGVPDPGRPPRAAPCTSSSASARCSGATRRWWRKRPRWR